MDTYNDGLDTAAIIIDNTMLSVKMTQKTHGSENIRIEDFYTIMNKVKELIDQHKEQE